MKTMTMTKGRSWPLSLHLTCLMKQKPIFSNKLTVTQHCLLITLTARILAELLVWIKLYLYPVTLPEEPFSVSTQTRHCQGRCTCWQRYAFLGIFLPNYVRNRAVLLEPQRGCRAVRAQLNIPTPPTTVVTQAKPYKCKYLSRKAQVPNL